MRLKVILTSLVLFIVALVAIGWTTGSILCSGWTDARARLILVAGPTVLAIGAIGLALFIGRDNVVGDIWVIAPVAISLFAMGIGIGSTWPHLLTRLLQALTTLDGLTSDEQRRHAIRQHADHVIETIGRSVPSARDRATILAADVARARVVDQE